MHRTGWSTASARFGTRAIPNQLALTGLRFHQPALVLDPSASNALGAVMSNAAAAAAGR